MPALDLLLRMQMSRTHMALVIDEYGGTDGLVSIEDVVESIVGDIEDEHDETETPIHPADGGAFLIEARASLDDVSEALGFDFASLADAEEVDTIGGLVTASAGRVPSRGEILKGPGGFRIRDSRRRSAPDQTDEALAACGSDAAAGRVAGGGCGKGPRRRIDLGRPPVVFRRPLPDGQRIRPEGGHGNPGLIRGIEAGALAVGRSRWRLGENLILASSV